LSKSRPASQKKKARGLVTPGLATQSSQEKPSVTTARDTRPEGRQRSGRGGPADRHDLDRASNRDPDSPQEPP